MKFNWPSARESVNSFRAHVSGKRRTLACALYCYSIRVPMIFRKRDPRQLNYLKQLKEALSDSPRRSRINRYNIYSNGKPRWKSIKRTFIIHIPGECGFSLPPVCNVNLRINCSPLQNYHRRENLHPRERPTVRCWSVGTCARARFFFGL